MPNEGRFQSIPNLKVVKATGIFSGVRNAGVARRTRGDAVTTGGTLRLSLDCWEAPIVFEVTAVERENLREAFALGHTDQRGIRKVHGLVPVLLHQLAHAGRIALIERRQQERRGLDTTPQRLLRHP